LTYSIQFLELSNEQLKNVCISPLIEPLER